VAREGPAPGRAPPRGGGLAGVSTGLADLDAMTLGLSPGLYLLAASTGTGRTALAGQIALHVAEHHGPVVVVSMELTEVDLGVRLVSALTRIKKEILVVGSLIEQQTVQVHAAVERLERPTRTSSMARATRPATFGLICCGRKQRRGHGQRSSWSTTCSCWSTRKGMAARANANVSRAAEGLKNLSGELGGAGAGPGSAQYHTPSAGSTKPSMIRRRSAPRSSVAGVLLAVMATTKSRPGMTWMVWPPIPAAKNTG
jgi:hypothetical protein